LDLNEVFSAIRSNDEISQICGDLINLGSVTRWTVDYLLQVKQYTKKSDKVALDVTWIIQQRACKLSLF
jgi:hypothetical protein